METKIREMLDENERELFRIVTDLLPCGNYGQSLAEFTDRRIITAHREEGGNIVCDTVLYSEVESLTIKRMYGNAFLLAVKKSGEKTQIARATYAVTALFNSAVLFMDKINSEMPTDEAMESVISAYRSFCTVCPKCGRNLVRPGADCLNCASKGKLVSKLVKYVKPEFKIICISVIKCPFLKVFILIPFFAISNSFIVIIFRIISACRITSSLHVPPAIKYPFIFNCVFILKTTARLCMPAF